jgi:hypothetical protein
LIFVALFFPIHHARFFSDLCIVLGGVLDHAARTSSHGGVEHAERNFYAG